MPITNSTPEKRMCVLNPKEHSTARNVHESQVPSTVQVSLHTYTTESDKSNTQIHILYDANDIELKDKLIHHAKDQNKDLPWEGAND